MYFYILKESLVIPKMPEVSDGGGQLEHWSRGGDSQLKITDTIAIETFELLISSK